TALGVAISQVGHAAGASTGGPSAAETAPIDTTGASLLVVSVVDYQHDPTTDSVTDTFGNDWHALKRGQGPGGNTNVALWYAWDHAGSPVQTGSGHKVTVNGNFSSIELTAWKGSAADVDPFDQQSTGGASALTAQPGSITPTSSGSLVVTAAGF